MLVAAQLHVLGAHQQVHLAAHAWQGFDSGAIGSGSSAVFNPAAPEGAESGWLYEDVSTIGEGNWMVSGHVTLTFTGTAAGGQVTVNGSGPAGGVIRGRATVPAGEATWEVPFFGVVNVAGGSAWTPAVTVGVTFATAVTTAVVYFHALGSCACRTR